MSRSANAFFPLMGETTISINYIQVLKLKGKGHSFAYNHTEQIFSAFTPHDGTCMHYERNKHKILAKVHKRVGGNHETYFLSRCPPLTQHTKSGPLLQIKRILEFTRMVSINPFCRVYYLIRRENCLIMTTKPSAKRLVIKIMLNFHLSPLACQRVDQQMRDQ